MKYVIELLVNGERQFKKEVTAMGVDEAICPNPEDHKTLEYLRKYLAGELKLPGRREGAKPKELAEEEKKKTINKHVELYNEIKGMDHITKDTVAKVRGGFNNRREQMAVVVGLRELERAGLIEFKEKIPVTVDGRKRYLKQYTVVKR